MCGRYALITPVDVLVQLLRIGSIGFDDPQPRRFNVAPTQVCPVLRMDAGGERSLDLLRWGLVPSWASDPSIGSKMINARSETAAQKPAFRDAMTQRRCVVPADGFYEWQPVGRRKQPYFVTRRDRQPMLFAGLWESWRRGKESLQTFTILTTDANARLEPLHDRMPVVLEIDDVPCWLALETAVEQSASLLRPASDDIVETRPVSARVNTVANDDPTLIEAVQPIADDGGDDSGQLGLFGSGAE